MTAGKLAFKSVIRAIDSNWTKKKDEKEPCTTTSSIFKYLQVFTWGWFCGRTLQDTTSTGLPTSA
jgi:hypothetical protein